MRINVALAACFFFTGCSSPDAADPNPPSACSDLAVCTDRCGLVVDACDAVVDCGACRDPNVVEQLQEAVDEAIGIWLDRSYMQDVIALDIDGVRAEVEERLRNTPGSDDVALLRGLWFALRSFRNGHAGVYRNDVLCRQLGGADPGVSVVGVCAQPFGDGFVVVDGPTGARGAGLEPGDVVVDVLYASGIGALADGLVERVLEQPLCSNAPTNDDGAVDMAASTVFATVRAGDRLTVRGLDGAIRTITIAETDLSDPVPCRFNARLPWVATTVRDDNIAVVRLTRFTLFPGEEGYIEVRTNADAQQLIDNMIDQVRVELEGLPTSVRGIVWDARGNVGGASPVGFAIAAGMRGRTDVALARCTTRVERSEPVAYFAGGPNYDLVADPRLVKDLPAALLIDGMAISAADYFARAVQLGTSTPIFGRPTTGGYGGGGTSTTLTNHPELVIAYDPYRCNDADGTPLETLPTIPDVVIEQDPADAAAGIDTVLEAAVAQLTE